MKSIADHQYAMLLGQKHLKLERGNTASQPASHVGQEAEAGFVMPVNKTDHMCQDITVLTEQEES